ncbi:MAG: DNA polymerase III subunit gamma/tau [Planctomycetes bacterium]|nr:DNA polymerase III subunit gamma/tau [Planctomycetota bacterium]
MAKSKSAVATVPAPAPAVAEVPTYTVVARRYRPQQFRELIGQEHVANALINALETGRVAHAYLFTGARGVGKTSAARILAKALNCERGTSPTPCDQCASCLAVAAGDDVDVLEIDGASNNKVEEIRDLRQGVGFRPTRGRFKIYIIDEVHMLTTNAFNALLKTLEEPPEHVKFILATTEVQKIPITILSRCQRFDFAHVGPAKIFDQLKSIVEREGHPADDDALRLVARRAAGSMRDSQSLLDQLLASSPGKLTAEHVSAVLGTAGDDRVIELAAAVLAGDAKTALDLIAAWVDRGLQTGELVDQLVEYWRALMLVSCGGPDVRELPVTENQFEAVKKHVQSISLDAILGGLEVLTATKTRMRGSTHTQVLLEMAVVRLCRLGELLSVGQLVQALNQPGAVSVVAASAGTAAPQRAAPVPVSPTPAPVAEGGKKNDMMAAKPGTNGSTGAEQSTVALTESSLPEVWGRFLHYAGQKSPILAKHLSFASSHATFGPNSLVIRFPAGYRDAREACAAESGVQRIQDALRRITGQQIAVKFETDASPAAQPANSAAPAPPVFAPTNRKKTLESLPLFKKARESLGAEIRAIDDDFNPFAAPRPARTGKDQDEDSGTNTDEG